MVFFFLLVGCEIKREILVGDLGDPKAAALPVVAAIGGMLLPALIYQPHQPRRERRTAGAFPWPRTSPFASPPWSSWESGCPRV
jgi:NhaA family Na+:H+ antiporter